MVRAWSEARESLRKEEGGAWAWAWALVVVVAAMGAAGGIAAGGCRCSRAQWDYRSRILSSSMTDIANANAVKQMRKDRVEGADGDGLVDGWAGSSNLLRFSARAAILPISFLHRPCPSDSFPRHGTSSQPVNSTITCRSHQEPHRRRRGMGISLKNNEAHKPPSTSAMLLRVP